MKSHQRLMDAIYRYQKHIYDPSRKFILPGRDSLINMFELQGNEKILEIGCGTARNLIKIAKKFPKTKLYGLDISNEMLKIARKKSKLYSNISIYSSSAEEFEYEKKDIEIAFFSYSLSMMPNWEKILDNVIDNIKSSGEVFIVDFYDQKGFPNWFRVLLQWWLSLFHVKYEEKLISHLKNMDNIQFELTPVFRRYSYIAQIIKK